MEEKIRLHFNAKNKKEKEKEMKYDCIQNADVNGKFGGYRVTPATGPQRNTRLYKLNVPLKYDPNKDLDKEKSNNGIDH